MCAGRQYNLLAQPVRMVETTNLHLTVEDVALFQGQRPRLNKSIQE